MSDRGTRVRAVGLGVLAVTFVVGLLAGAAIMRAFDAGDDRRDRDDDRRRGYVFEQLDLTDAQRAAIDSVLEVRRAQVDAFWDSAGPRLREIVDSTRAGIKDALTPEQRDEYERLLREARERHRDDDRDREKEEEDGPERRGG